MSAYGVSVVSAVLSDSGRLFGVRIMNYPMPVPLISIEIAVGSASSTCAVSVADNKRLAKAI